MRCQEVSPRERTSTALTRGVPLRVGVRAWRERSLKETYYPYLYLDAIYLNVNWGGSVVGMVLLGCTGVDEEGLREVFAVAGGEKGAAYSSLLRCLLDRGLMGVGLIASDDREGIKADVSGGLPGVDWQRCVMHFQRNVLSHVPASAMSEVAEDLKRPSR